MSNPSTPLNIAPLSSPSGDKGKYFGAAQDLEAELEYYEIAALPLDEFKAEEKRRPQFYPESERVHFYFYVQLHAIQTSRLDIIKYLDETNNLQDFNSQYYLYLWQSNNPEMIDFYLYEKNIKITDHQFKIIKTNFADSGILQKLEKRELEKSVTPHPPLSTSTLKI